MLSSANTETPDVHDARGLPREVVALQATSPNSFAVTALDGHRFAWVKPAGPSGPDSLLVADPLTVQNWFQDEWRLGSMTGWPKTIRELLGPQAMATTRSAEQHQRLRVLFSPMRTNDLLSRILPTIQHSVQAYMKDWAAKDTVPAYTETLTLVFDILVNQALQLGWSDAEIKQYAQLFEVWNQGFTASTEDSRFAKGMEARPALIARFRQSLKDPQLLKGSIPAALRDEYGADSEVCTDNLIMVIFAGFETTTSLVTGLLYHLAQQQAVLEKLRAEHKAVVATHGSTLGLASLKDMRLTDAAISETLRLAQIVANVPRYTTKAVETPGAPKLPSGCPFSACWGGMSVLDPAVKGEEHMFRPERCLDANNTASLQLYQHPFGYGTHDCLGWRIAHATAAAVAQELSLKYSLSADTNTTFSDFPTGGRPVNELPISLKALE